MVDVHDLSRNQLEFLCEELLGFVYMFRNSFISDVENFDNLDPKDSDVQEEYKTLMECFYSASDAEDKVLHTEWLVREVARAVDEDEGCEDFEEEY